MRITHRIRLLSDEAMHQPDLWPLDTTAREIAGMVNSLSRHKEARARWDSKCCDGDVVVFPPEGKLIHQYTHTQPQDVRRCIGHHVDMRCSYTSSIHAHHQGAVRNFHHRSLTILIFFVNISPKNMYMHIFGLPIFICSSVVPVGRHSLSWCGRRAEGDGRMI